MRALQRSHARSLVLQKPNDGLTDHERDVFAQLCDASESGTLRLPKVATSDGSRSGLPAPLPRSGKGENGGASPSLTTESLFTSLNSWVHKAMQLFHKCEWAHLRSDEHEDATKDLAAAKEKFNQMSAHLLASKRRCIKVNAPQLYARFESRAAGWRKRPSPVSRPGWCLRSCEWCAIRAA